MTEADWLHATELAPMLGFLLGASLAEPGEGSVTGWAAERPLRFFACGCTRRLGQRLHDARSWRAVELSEEVAAISPQAVAKFDVALLEAVGEEVGAGARQAVADAMEAALHAPTTEVRLARLQEYSTAAVAEQLPLLPTGIVEPSTIQPAIREAWHVSRECGALTETEQIALLRDVAGNPYRPTQIEPSWLLRGEKAALHIARAIVDESRFEDLPVLADALEDAGCAEVSLLDHCRGGGVHVRGCWALEALRHP